MIEYSAGGLKHAIDIKYRVADLKNVKTLQIVQVLYASPMANDGNVYRFKVNSVDFVGLRRPWR